MLRARKVDEYMSDATGYDMSWLQLLMTNASGGFFGNIWIPTRQYDPNTNTMSENYTYYNVGMQPDELADLYWTEYSGNYLIGRRESIDTDYTYLATRCRAIFKKNLGKYKKLVEMEGLIWNPLWNVDGTELHQILEQHADEITKDTGSGESFKGQNLKDERNVAPYDSSGLKKEYEETHTGMDGSKTPSASSTIGNVTVSSSTTTAVPSVSESEASASSSVNVRSHSSFEYAVPIKDTAFGVALTGGDTLHTEKHVKQGNIGVTETTTLLNHARDYLRFSIIQEFFNDINKVILIGVYGNSEPVPWWYGQGSGQKTPTHPDTGRISSVYNSGYDSIQSVELDEYGPVVGLTTCDGVTKVFTPMTQEQYEQTDPKDQTLYHIYD